MRALLLAAFAAFTVFAGGQAQAAATCSPFTAFPLVLNFGSGLNTGTGEDLNCFAQKVQAAVNTLPSTVSGLSTTVGTLSTTVSGLSTTVGTNTSNTATNTSAVATLNGKIGAANGIATLDGSTLLPVAQLPAAIRPAQLGVASGIATLGSDGILTAAQRPPGGGGANGVPITPTSINMSAAPSLVHFYSGQNATTNLVVDVTAVSATAAEQSGMFIMHSTTGAGGGVGAYKMANGAEATCGSGSAPCWANTSVLTTTNGYPSAGGQIVYEVDHNNNSGFDCPDANPGAGGAQCGSMLITGNSANQVNYGLNIAGANKIRNGILFQTGGPIATSIRDYSASQVAYKDTGSHVNGWDGTGATYSGNAFASTNFSVAGATGVVTTPLVRFIPRTFSSLPACNASTEGTRGYITDAASASYGATTAGGGGFRTPVYCNSANWING